MNKGVFRGVEDDEMLIRFFFFDLIEVAHEDSYLWVL